MGLVGCFAKQKAESGRVALGAGFPLEHRRAVVDERTGLSNRLIALLKSYFPQALVLCGEDRWRPLATALRAI
jgi:hypothetical protein